MMREVFVRSFNEPPVSVEEILRYANCKRDDSEILKLADSVVDEARNCLTYKVCYSILPIESKGETLKIGNFSLVSENLSLNLKNSQEVLVFALTVGVGIDRLIAKYSYLSPTRALLLQAFGSERAEALCEVFCRDFERPLYPRFSPGYGDLPLDVQRDIFNLLDCPKNIGLTLNESMMMSPTKSVTAFAGIKQQR